jgi:hypothetical protein
MKKPSIETDEELVAITRHWDRTNDRRCELIDQSIAGRRLTPSERAEMARAERLAEILLAVKDLIGAEKSLQPFRSQLGRRS